MAFTKTERKMITKIRQYVKSFLGGGIHRFNLAPGEKRYDFWFLYDNDDNAVGWEGGFCTCLTVKFRNQFSVET